MKDRISIILAGFNPIFCLGLKQILSECKEYKLIHCFNLIEEVDDYIVNGGKVDLLIMADNLSDVIFIPKNRNIKSLVFTNQPEKFRYDNWFYVGISGTLNWDIGFEEFYKSIRDVKNVHCQKNQTINN